MKAVRIHEQGGPEVLRFEEVAVPQPGPGEARVRVRAAGVNFIDVYHRSGVYKVPLPFALGQEGAGVVDAVGEGVTEVKAGDRVAWAMHGGGYAEYAVVPAWKLAPLPEGISFEDGAAVMLQGTTAHYLTHSTFPVRAGHRVLIHAAAGGTGLLFIQIAKRLGATVIGTAGSDEKAALARSAGADAVINYRTQDFVAEVKRLTEGKGVHAVYDSVGQQTFLGSIKCLAPRGYMVSFGQSSGSVPAFDPQILAGQGSVFFTRPSLGHYVATRDELLSRTNDLFAWMAAGQLKLRIDSTFPLAEAAAAQRRIESRASSGKILLTN